MTTKIELKKELPKNPVVIESFPSKGFVSTIATKYMLEELGMEIVGNLSSDRLTSIAMIHDAKPMYPVRIYAKDPLVLIFSEISIPFKDVPEISGVLEKWLGELQPREVLLLAGISGKVTEKEHDILGLATTLELKKKLDEIGIKKVEEGMLTGISSNLLLYCYGKEIPTISLMAETEYTPDPLAAASMLQVLNKLLNLNINTEKLMKEGKKIEEVFKRITEELKRSQLHHKKMEDYSPMYA